MRLAGDCPTSLSELGFVDEDIPAMVKVSGPRDACPDRPDESFLRVCEYEHVCLYQYVDTSAHISVHMDAHLCTHVNIYVNTRVC